MYELLILLKYLNFEFIVQNNYHIYTTKYKNTNVEITININTKNIFVEYFDDDLLIYKQDFYQKNDIPELIEKINILFKII